MNWTSEQLQAVKSRGLREINTTPSRRDLPAIEMTEAELQSACERELIERGYSRLTPAAMVGPQSGKGWFSHLPRCKGNPIHPDITLFDGAWRLCIGIELKTRTGRVSTYQQR